MAQLFPEAPPEPMQNAAIVIIHPGSYWLRLGRASDAYPQSIQHCISRRHKHPGQQKSCSDPWMIRQEAQYPHLEPVRVQGLSAAQEAIQYRPMSLGGYRQSSSTQQLALVNNTLRGEQTEVKSGLKWTDSEGLKLQTLFGEEALYVRSDACYNLHWPIQHGRFNLHDRPGGTLTAIVQDLEEIWGNAIQNLLEIPLKDLRHYRAVLLIPDIYNRTHVREMLSVILDRLGFSSAFIVQESVCATFGAGTGSACVVDVGDQKTSVCCVEDGISQKNTRVVMEMGGSDISRCFLWLLQRAGLPYHTCDLNNRFDALFIQELKESFCHLDQDNYGVDVQHMQLKLPDQCIIKYNMHVGDERILAPLSLFIPDMLALHGEHLLRVPERYYSDPADARDEDYIKQTMSKHELAARSIARRKKEAAEIIIPNPDGTPAAPPQSNIEDEDEDTMDPLDNNGDTSTTGNKPKEEEDGAEFLKQGGIMGIDQAILLSIANCETDDMKKRMYSCMVIVGGGLTFSGADSWIKYLIWTQMPAHFRSQLETMDVFTEAKEMDPRYTCWKGGAVMCCLDTAQELWIKQREWKKEGIKLVRERAPFVWCD